MNISFPKMPDRLTKTQQTILEYITGHREEFLCMTIDQMSVTLSISEATISRFARHMGCRDYKHLKQVVMEQTVQRGPAQKLANTLRTRSDDFLQDWIEQQQYNLQKTLELMDKDEFVKGVDAIRKAHRVFLYAKNASRSPAQLLEYRLQRIGIDVRRISSGGSELLENLAFIQEDDLVILFGFSKVSAEGQVILDYEKQAGYTTLLFTGKTYHDEVHRADINLFVYRGEENEYHSMSAPVAIADALVLSLSAQMGTDAVDRLEKIRKLKIEYGKQL